MTREQILNKIREKLAIFETEIRLANSADEYDINRHSENMLIPILDIVFSCSFQNLNYTEKKNYPAIDLGDPEKGLAVQVTSTGTRRKVTDCLDLFNKYEQGKTYSSLLFYFLAEPQKKISLSSEAVIKRLGSLEPERIQFFSNKTLYDRLHDFRTDQLKDVLDILEKEYPDSLQSSSPVSLTPFPPYDHSADLPGRNKFFTDLKASLLPSYPVIVLTGPAGTGKTYAAARLCHDIKIDKLGSTAWVTYSGDLKSDLLALDLFKDHDSAHRADRITDHLKTVSEPLYLFIDNNKTGLSREDISLINQFSPYVRVVITSRNRISAFQNLKLPVLDRMDAASMYEAHSGQSISADENTLFDRLLRFASSNTLLIELLAKYARCNCLTLSDLVNRLSENGIMTMNSAALETVYSENPMTIREFLIKLYDLSALSDKQQHIMSVLSVFPPEIPFPVMLAEPAGFDMAALSDLAEGGWVRSAAERLCLHPVIRDTVLAQDIKAPDFRTHKEFMRAISNTHAYLGGGTSFAVSRSAIAVPEAVADHLLFHHMEDKATADLCLNLSKAFRRNGDLSKAEKYVKAARRIFQRFYGKGSLQAARALRQYAEIMSDLGRIDTAVRLVNQSLRICQNRADQSAEAASCDLLGKIYNKAEKYAEAVPPLESALSIRRSINPKAADTANTLHHLGMAYGKTGRIAGAVSAFTEALDIRRSVFQGDHIQTAAALSRLGDVYRSAEDYDQAFACYHQAFEMFKNLSALDHPFAGSTYLGLGYCYKRMGRADDAAMAFDKAYRLCIQEYGPDHPHTLEVKKQVH